MTEKLKNFIDNIHLKTGIKISEPQANEILLNMIGDDVNMDVISLILSGITNENKKKSLPDKKLLVKQFFDGMPKEHIERYKDLLVDDKVKEVFADAQLVGTAQAFFMNNMNASETAKIMYMHRNTLAYRLNRIEKNTGLNIRQFEDAVAFKILLEIYY